MSTARAHVLNQTAHVGRETSDLDDAIHTELCMLYRESVETIHFAKARQWKTLGGTLVLFGAILALDYAYQRAGGLDDVLLLTSLLICAGALYALAIYQTWQNTERGKLHAISAKLSHVTHEIRAIKSRREASLFRYMLLCFMVAGVAMGQVIVLMVLTGKIH